MTESVRPSGATGDGPCQAKVAARIGAAPARSVSDEDGAGTDPVDVSRTTDKVCDGTVSGEDTAGASDGAEYGANESPLPANPAVSGGFSTCCADRVEHAHSSMEFGCFGMSSVLGRGGGCPDSPVRCPGPE